MVLDWNPSWTGLLYMHFVVCTGEFNRGVGKDQYVYYVQYMLQKSQFLRLLV